MEELTLSLRSSSHTALERDGTRTMARGNEHVCVYTVGRTNSGRDGLGRARLSGWILYKALSRSDGAKGSR